MNQKSVFWEALLLAIFIFASGMAMGYFLELNRTNKIISTYQQLELNLLDIKVQDNIISLSKFDCDVAIKEMINFADRTYNESKTLDRYEDSASISEGIKIQHKKYDLLRAILWSDTLKIREKCGNNFHTIVYFYEYDSQDIDIQSQQNVFSKYLGEIKEKKGSNVILIPIAGNLDSNSIAMLRSSYQIKSLPTILVDENMSVSSINDLNKIEAYLN